MKLPKCPVELTMLFLADRKKIMIICYLLKGTLRAEILLELVGGVSKNKLTKILHELEALGVIERIVYKEIPPKVEYSLTEFGMSFSDIIETMNVWGIEYLKILVSEEF